MKAAQTPVFHSDGVFVQPGRLKQPLVFKTRAERSHHLVPLNPPAAVLMVVRDAFSDLPPSAAFMVSLTPELRLWFPLWLRAAIRSLLEALRLTDEVISWWPACPQSEPPPLLMKHHILPHLPPSPTPTPPPAAQRQRDLISLG